MSNPSSPSRLTEWHVFPPPEPKWYREGDVVFIRTKSAKEKGRRGVIRSVSLDGTRALVRSIESDVDDNEEKWEKSVASKRLIPVFSNSDLRHRTTVLVTSETAPYRHLAASQLRQESDHVLEIGCSTGEASAVMTRYACSWVGFDTSTEMIRSCTTRLSKCTTGTSRRFPVKMDPFVDNAGATKYASKFCDEGPTVVFVDIGGNRDLSSVLQMIAWPLQSWCCRLIVIKSRELFQEISMNSGLLQEDGNFSKGQKWFKEKLASSSKTPCVPPHPLQAPLVLSPMDNETPICRYHNYHRNGCKKEDDCPLDHKHCHWCKRAGHIARECSVLLNDISCGNASND